MKTDLQVDSRRPPRSRSSRTVAVPRRRALSSLAPEAVVDSSPFSPGGAERRQCCCCCGEEEEETIVVVVVVAVDDRACNNRAFRETDFVFTVFLHPHRIRAGSGGGGGAAVPAAQLEQFESFCALFLSSVTSVAVERVSRTITGSVKSQ